MENAYHYKVIERAIKEIDAADHQLSLQELAARVGVSPAHFQRTFRQWVGITPKRYQQYLALGLSRQLLQEKCTTFETSLNTGLSSPSRLHDLFIRWEAMSPGEYAQAGQGVTIHWDWFTGPFGPFVAMATARGICGLGFLGDGTRADALADMQKRWPKATYVHDTKTLIPLVDPILAQKGDVSLHLMGSHLQLKVWEALLHIPLAHVTTYSHLAQRAGNAKAVRAVGTAVGRNPIAWLIPCHRVVRKSGDWGGYHWGVPIKRALLAYEAARAQVLPAD